MSRTRSHAEVQAALTDPGFTPGARDVAPLVALVLGDEAIGDAAAHVLPRAGAAAVRAALARSGEATPRGRVRLARMAPRGAPAEEARAWLVGRLADTEAAVRRAAAAELGKPALATAEVAAALEAALATEPDASARRALMTALGKIGGDDAAAALGAALRTASLGPAADAGPPALGDASTERVRARAALMAARPTARGSGVRIDLDRAPARATPVILHCRNGLEPLLVAELARELAAAPSQDGFGRGGRVAATLRAPPATLLRSRIMLGFGFPLPIVESAAHGGLPGAIAAALGGDRAAEVLATCTRSADATALPGQLPAGIRYRIRWARAGKRRAQVWDAALAIRATRPELVNDPSDSDWEVVVHELASPDGAPAPPPARSERRAPSDAHPRPGARVLVELQPRFDDPRFAYRVGDVPAASHPTVAAALVHASVPRDDDVVWDPFVGSGLELCERARAGAYARLIGSDLSAEVSDIARRNLESVGAERFELLVGDARSPPPPAPPTLIITNPPMGRRVHRGGMLEELLAAFLRHAAGCLAPRGRLVWISPLGDRSARAAEASGLRLGARHAIDMGGFVADLEVWHKR